MHPKTLHALMLAGATALLGGLAGGCSSTAQAAAPPGSAATAAQNPAKGNPKPIDPGAVGTATGGKPEASEKVVKVSFPRNDLPVAVDGWNNVPPFMGLTSWAAFTPGEKPGVEAMVMGDLVVFEDEVNPVMSAALDNGLEVTALHNHFFYDKPHVFFMHIGGEGSVESLGKGVKAALDAAKSVRQKSAQPHEGFGAPALTTPSKIDAAKLDPVFTIKGQTKDGMYKAVMGRTTTAACGCSVGKAMGVNTWAAFAGTDENAVVDGDFAVAENELQPVLKALRAGGINIVAIHHHMTDEKPRILFLHYWGRGTAASLAKTVKQALDLTDWEGKKGRA
ncbi:MAG TPA: DUF1259 domain-containing protein [Polyangiaceae bacterium]